MMIDLLDFSANYYNFHTTICLHKKQPIRSRDGMSATQQPGKSRQNRYAVIIGINRYQDGSIPGLQYARADAEEIYRVLTDPQLGGISEKNAVLLLDEDATQKNIRRAIGNELRRRAGEDDVVYIYYAGHGAPEADSRSGSPNGLEKYLVPYDGEADDLYTSAISMKEIKDFFRRLYARQVIFFIDSCYSGTAGGRTFPHPGQRTRNIIDPDFIDELGGEGRLVITSCHVNEVSLEVDRYRHGLFTYHLLEGLRGKADLNRDGAVSIEELYSYVYEQVSRQSRWLNAPMHPMRKGMVVGNIILTRYQTEAQKEAEALRPQARELLKAKKFDEVLPLWRKILILLPGDEEAQKAVAAIEQHLKAEDARREQLRRKREQKLLHHYDRREIDSRTYSEAIELIGRDPAQLDEAERRRWRLHCDLADGEISLATYRRSMALLRQDGEKKTPDDRAEVPPAPPRPPQSPPVEKTDVPSLPPTPPQPPPDEPVKPAKPPRDELELDWPKILRLSLLTLAVIVLAVAVYYFSTRDRGEENILPESVHSQKSSSLEKMVHIIGGTFQMGSDDGSDDEKPVHSVTVSDFYLGKYEVTFTEYDLFCAATGRLKPDDSDWGRGQRPVINVDWYDAVEYCNWRSAQENLTPCYQIDKSRKDPKNDNSNDTKKWLVSCDFNANGYRLPTEAEWEYAARGGQKSQGYTYSGNNDASLVAWYRNNSMGKTQPIGKKIANELGLYDMSGNVWEWCWDWYYNQYYANSVRVDPKGPLGGSLRIVRSSSWHTVLRNVRSANRNRNGPNVAGNLHGFRLSRTR